MSYQSIAQDWRLLSQHATDQPASLVNIDRLNNIYLVDHKGNVQKRDSSGYLLSQFAPQQYGRLASLDTWNSMRVFLFYRDLQQYVFLDRFLNPAEFLGFQGGNFGMIMLAAPSNDNQLWLLEQSPLTLVKYDMNFNAISMSLPLNQLADTVDLQPYQLLEYQNRLYLADEKLGILVFDNIGNYLRAITKPNSATFYPWEDQFYYMLEDQLCHISLYEDKQEVIDLPNSAVWNHVLRARDALVLISGKEIYFYRYSP